MNVCELILTQSFEVLKKATVVVLVCVLSFTDILSILNFPYVQPLEKAYAATGNFSIFREATGTETVPTSTQPVRDSTWDTTVSASGNIALQTNASDIDLADGGKYLVLYNVWSEQGTSTLGSNRRSQRTWLTLAGTELPYGIGGGYLRDSDNTVYMYNSGSAIINAVAGDDLQVHVRRDDANTTGVGANVRPDTNGISVLKLKDSWDYLRIYKTTSSADIDQNTTFTDVLWDTSDEVDTGSFGFTPSSVNVTLKGDDNDHFLVTTNVKINKTDNSTRESYEMRLTLDGVEIPGTRVTGYIRGNTNGDDIFDDTLVYTGIIKKDTIGDQTLNVELRRESSASGGVTVIVGGQTALSIVALPDDGSYIMLADDSGTQTLASARTAINWNTQQEVESTAFSHSTTTNSSRINIDSDGDYLFFATAYGTTTTNDRQPPRFDWRKNGSTVLQYGSFGSYIRGSQSFAGGASGGLIMNGLTASDYIEVTQFDETEIPVDVNLNANRLAVQGVKLDANFFGTDVFVTASGTQRASYDIPSTAAELGGKFVITEQTSSRNLTSVTVTEQGSVNAQTGLNNIKLYYDLDTTNPYDCSSESYGGSEAQFGATDTNGFSGADGISTFSGSVAISTSQTFCGYVVYDIASTTSDGDTVDIVINDTSTDVVLTGSPTIGPLSVVDITGSTTLRNAELTQVHYNWRNDDGTETTATSVEGAEDTPAIGFANGTTRRLRLEVSNEGSISSGGSVSILDAFSTGNTKTISVGTERLLVVGIHSEDSGLNTDVNTVTYGGQTLTEIRDTQVGGGFSNGMWVGYLNETGIQNAVGTTISPTWNGGTPDESVLYSSVVYENVDQTSPITGWSSNTGTSISTIQGTSSIPVGLGDRSVYFTVSGAQGQTHTAPADYTEGTEEDSGGAGQVASNAQKTISVDGNEQPTATWSGTANRLAIVNVGINVSSSVSTPQQYRLEYAQKVSTCSVASTWIDVGEAGGDWDVVDTVNLTDGNDTTNIPLQSNGGVTDENVTFLTPNGAQKDTSSQTNGLILSPDEFVEIEYAIEPTAGAPQGNTYCFRVSDAGTPLNAYNVYAEGTISADIDVSASSSQVTSLNTGATNQYIGGTFVIERQGTARTLTSITITETGTIDAQANLANPTLYYDLDTTSPYDCTGESYSGTENSVLGSAFTSANGSSTFTGSISLTSTQSFCGYVIFDIGNGAPNGETINIEITDPSTDVVVTTSTVGPSTAVSPTGSTTVAGPVRTQTGYHWRNDDGSETLATSAAGDEDTAISEVPKESTRRIRVQVSNEGTVSTQASQYRLEYGTKISTCSVVASWTDVGEVGGAFNMSTSTNIIDGSNTTDISTSTGGVSNPGGKTFLGTNGGLRDLTSETGLLTLTSTQYVEMEYAIEATPESGYNTTYCFRITDTGTALESYTSYPELTTREKRDFFIQRGTETITGASVTLVAGTDYIVPSASTSAFVRITNSSFTGAGDNNLGGQQNADDVTTYISNPENIETSFTITRAGLVDNTRVSWEIVEYVGLVGADNEMLVRDQGTLTYGATSLYATGTSVSTVSDDNDVVVFITGQLNPNTGTSNYNDGLSTSFWNGTSTAPVFERGDADTVATQLSFAVVEFTGANWNIQRIEHNYTATGTTETEEISAVNALSKTFIHAQKRVGNSLSGLDEYGHQVWLSSIGQVSFQLRQDANVASDHYSVAWVIENTQTGSGAMNVQQSDGTISSGGAEPSTHLLPISTGIVMNNASLFITNDSTGAGTYYPRTILGARITKVNEYELWRSDTGQNQSYRTEIVEWPVAELALRQNYYRFYVDNDALDPTDPWPVGASDLGENTSITTNDDPLGEGERFRLRMTMAISNALLPAETQTFKLQYARRDTTCSAISSWTDVGAIESGTIWRGYDATPADGTELATSTPAPGTLNISVSDIAGTYEEANSTAINPYSGDIGEDIEYDWHVEHNGATQRSDYCFRMTYSDDTELAGYNNYPTVRTTGYTPVIGNWRWYDDEGSITPSSPLAAENAAPIDIANANVIKLRATAKEVEGAPGTNVKFSLEYSEYSNFGDGGTILTSTSSCVASSTWCYADAAGIDNNLIDSAVLSDADACTGGSGAGCGTHNEAATTTSTLTHPSLGIIELEFAIKPTAVRANAVYYFRMVDSATDDKLIASTSYPSLVTEGASLIFSVAGLPSSTITEGVTTDVATTPATVSFGSLPFDTEYTAAHRVSVDTNATEGYQILTYARQGFLNTYGTTIDPVTGSNSTPSGWSTGCILSADGCFGYHAGDDSLNGGSTRFAGDDSYAAFETTPREIMYSSVPVSESSDIVYKVQVGQGQPAGEYVTDVVYLAIPVF